MLSCPIHTPSIDKEFPSSSEVPTSSLPHLKRFWRVDIEIQALGWLLLPSEHLNHCNNQKDQVTEVTYGMIHSCFNTLVVLQGITPPHFPPQS